MSVLFFPAVGFAVPTISGDVNEDLFFPNGVQIKKVKFPSDINANVGSSSVEIGGVGTVTVSDQRVGEFPQMIIFGGTTITSTRDWGGVANKVWWDGKLFAPRAGREPHAREVDFKFSTGRGSDFQVFARYQWGLDNETFSFSPTPARIWLPVGEQDGSKIWVAFLQPSGAWEVEKDSFCVAWSGICVIDVSTVKSVVLIRENKTSCPNVDIENGRISGPPNCVLQCDRGFEPSEDWASCVRSEGVSPQDLDLRSSAGRQSSWRPGYFRYRATQDQTRRKLDTAGLEGEDLKIAQHSNRSYLGRNPRSIEEQVKRDEPEKKTNESEDSFLNYLLQVRNMFGENSSGNRFDQSDEEFSDETEFGEGDEGDFFGEDDSGGGLYNSAPLLPSTGPGIFAGLAILGIGTMIFGASRRK